MMINLCICANLMLEDHSGGMNRILNLAKNVSTHKVNVYLVGRSQIKSPFSILIDNGKYTQINNGIAKEYLYPIGIRFFFPGFIKFTQEFLRKILRILTFTFSPDLFGLSDVIDPCLFVKLFFVCKKERINIIQFEFPAPSISSFLVKKLLRIPLVYDAHNIEIDRVKSMDNVSIIYFTLAKVIETFSCKIADLVFVVSERDKERMVSSGVLEHKVKTIPNSVEISKFSRGLTNKIKVQYKLEKKIVLLFHGPLDYPPNKEAANILTNKLLPNILKRHSNVHLLLVGRNPPRISHPNITTTGFVENLPDYVAAADIALVPLLKGGGTRIKILEYMAAGKAVVSTVKGAEGLDLQNGKDILLTEYPDSKFIDLVTQLIEDNSLRENIGLNAQRKAVSLYSWKETGEKAVQEYNKIIPNSKRIQRTSTKIKEAY